MTRISKGTVSVDPGGTTATLWAGDGGVVLSEITAPAGSQVVIEGMANFIKERLSTTSFELEEAHTGAGGAGLRCMVSAMTATETSVGTLNARTATVIQELSVLDANGRGLFYNLIGVTGANDPGPGNLAFDNADPALVSELYFDVLDANEGGRNVEGILDLWPVGTVVIVRSLASNAYAAFQLEGAPMDAGGYRMLPVSYVDSDGTLADEPVAVEWRLAGADRNFDVQVALLADRAGYDAEELGFRVLVSNVGDGRAAVYSKLSAAAGDWSEPAYFTGPGITLSVDYTEVAHDAPPAVSLIPVAGGYQLHFDLPDGMVIQGGPVTTLDPGVPATADLVPIVGGYRLDLGLPRGPTGDINGVTPFWHNLITVNTSQAAAQDALDLRKQASTTDATAGRVLALGAFGLGDQVVTTEPDLDTYFTAGTYVTPQAGLLGLPSGWEQGRHILRVGGGTSYASQIISGASINEGRVAFREGGSIGGWGEWREFNLQTWSEALDAYGLELRTAANYSAERRLAPLIGGKVRVEPVQKSPSNPILPFGGSGAWDEGGLRSFMPAITEDGLLAQLGGNYFGYYYGSNAAGTNREIGRANSPDLQTWTKQVGNPVFTGSGVAGRFDEAGVNCGNVILMDDDTLRLYYVGMADGLVLSGMGMATSADGVSWTRSGTAPMISPTLFNLTGVFGMPYVVKTTLGWFMTCEGQSKGFGGYGVFAASSSDGLAWTALNGGNPILGGDINTWTRGGLANPKLCEISPGIIMMTFNAASFASYWRSTVAVTTDPNLLEWQVLPSGAFLGQGAGNAWDSHRIEDAWLVKDDIVNGASEVRMFYFGTNTDAGVISAQIGMATIPQTEEHFPFWLPDQAGVWTVESAPAPWGSSTPALKITDIDPDTYGYVCSRPFALGRDVSVRFTLYVESIDDSGVSSHGFRVSLRDGPDHLAQASFTHPCIVVRRTTPDNFAVIHFEYFDGSTGTMVDLTTISAGVSYQVEMRLRAAEQKYDVILSRTGNAPLAQVLDVDAGSTRAKHCLVVDGFSSVGGVLYVGDVQIGPG